MKKKNKRFQLNKYVIKWSKPYERWQVLRDGYILEEFKEVQQARDWALNN